MINVKNLKYNTNMLKKTKIKTIADVAKYRKKKELCYSKHNIPQNSNIIVLKILISVLK